MSHRNDQSKKSSTAFDQASTTSTRAATTGRRPIFGSTWCVPASSGGLHHRILDKERYGIAPGLIRKSGDGVAIGRFGFALSSWTELRGGYIPAE
jgi:hypothetical protein